MKSETKIHFISHKIFYFIHFSIMEDNLNELTAISPIDGRYRKYTAVLKHYFSEYAFMRARVSVEVRWLLFLDHHLPKTLAWKSFSQSVIMMLRGIVLKFSEKDAMRIKEIESLTRHDVKAIEYFIKEKLEADEQGKAVSEFVHLACTSEDINNIALARNIKDALEFVILPEMKEIILELARLAIVNAAVPMMSHTHGQPATPTTIGKEFAVFALRLYKQYQNVKGVTIYGKANGAVGNYNAHMAAYPDINWPEINKEFVESFQIANNPLTTQIEPHDYLAELFHATGRFNTILIDFNQDMWQYISKGYFKQILLKGEVGSSTMPHKINPIAFENAQGNLEMANANFNFMASKLPISRMQRDLTDSTVLRNIGVGFAHSLVAYKSTLQGLDKVTVDAEAMKRDLNNHWELMAEPIQTIMRSRRITSPYEKLKETTQGKPVSEEDIKSITEKFAADANLDEEETEKLMKITPETYIGNAKKQAETIMMYLSNL